MGAAGPGHLLLLKAEDRIATRGQFAQLLCLGFADRPEALACGDRLSTRSRNAGGSPAATPGWESVNRKAKSISASSSIGRYHHRRVLSAPSGQRPRHIGLIASTAAPCSWASSSTCLPNPSTKYSTKLMGNITVSKRNPLSLDRGLRRVRGEAQVADFAFLPGFQQVSIAHAGAQRLLDLRGLDQCMELVEIEVIGLQERSQRSSSSRAPSRSRSIVFRPRNALPIHPL